MTLTEIPKSLDKIGLDVGAYYYKYGSVFYGQMSATNLSAGIVNPRARFTNPFAQIYTSSFVFLPCDCRGASQPSAISSPFKGPSSLGSKFNTFGHSLYPKKHDYSQKNKNTTSNIMKEAHTKMVLRDNVNAAFKYLLKIFFPLFHLSKDTETVVAVEIFELSFAVSDTKKTFLNDCWHY